MRGRKRQAGKSECARNQTKSDASNWKAKGMVKNAGKKRDRPTNGRRQKQIGVIPCVSQRARYRGPNNGRCFDIPRGAISRPDDAINQSANIRANYWNNSKSKLSAYRQGCTLSQKAKSQEINCTNSAQAGNTHDKEGCSKICRNDISRDGRAGDTAMESGSQDIRYNELTQQECGQSGSPGCQPHVFVHDKDKSRKSVQADNVPDNSDQSTTRCIKQDHPSADQPSKKENKRVTWRTPIISAIFDAPTQPRVATSISTQKLYNIQYTQRSGRCGYGSNSPNSATTHITTIGAQAQSGRSTLPRQHNKVCRQRGQTQAVASNGSNRSSRSSRILARQKVLREVEQGKVKQLEPLEPVPESYATHCPTPGPTVRKELLEMIKPEEVIRWIQLEHLMYPSAAELPPGKIRANQIPKVVLHQKNVY